MSSGGEGQMASPTLETLPVEVILSIAELLDTNSITRLSETCSLLHQLIFDPNHDSIWRPSCLVYGVSPTVDLDDLMVAGNDDPGNGRSWLTFCKLLKAWKTPFPRQSTAALPSVRLATQHLPESCPKDTKYTISMACAGCGDIRGTISSVEDPVRTGNDGRALVSVRDLVNKSPTLEGELDIFTATIGPGYRQSRDQRRLMARKFSAYPHQSVAGLLFSKQPGNWKISRLDGSTGQIVREWDLGLRRPDRAASQGDILVAMTWDQRDESDEVGMISPPPFDPSHLVCVRASGSRWHKKSEVLWECDINEHWAEEEIKTAFPILKIFHLTRTHLIALVTRHNPSNNKKLTATRFQVVDVLTGETQRTITIPKVSASNSRSSFLTTFDHNFVVNDAFIVCGGVAGDLDVWHYNDPAGTPAKPLYTLPSPFISAADAAAEPPNPADMRPARFRGTIGGPVPRLYSNLCISTCGRYVAATTSNQIWTFDMVGKTISSCHHNAREVRPHEFYAKNPPDDFPSGIWLRWIEWHRDENSNSMIAATNGRNWLQWLTMHGTSHAASHTSSKTKKTVWKRGKTHTAYVTNIRSDDDSVEAYLRRRSRWSRHLPRVLLELATELDLSWFWLFGLLALFCAVILAVQPVRIPALFTSTASPSII